MFTQMLKSRLKRFTSETEGYVTTEAIIVLPALLWLFAVGWVYFDVFRQQSVNQKANYVVGDMISRETDPITDTYIDNARELLYHLDKSSGEMSDIRVTVVRYDANKDKWKVWWSKSRGSAAPLKNNNMNDYAPKLPVASHNDQLIIVETWDEYDPLFNVGLDAFEITTYSFTRPRYTPQVLFDNG